jgi:hypothetical protein
LPLQEKKNAGGAKTEMANGSENVLGRLLSLLLVAAEALLLRSPLLHRETRREKADFAPTFSRVGCVCGALFLSRDATRCCWCWCCRHDCVVLAPRNARAPLCFLLSSSGRFLLLLGGLLFVS